MENNQYHMPPLPLGSSQPRGPAVFNTDTRTRLIEKSRQIAFTCGRTPKRTSIFSTPMASTSPFVTPLLSSNSSPLPPRASLRSESPNARSPAIFNLSSEKDGGRIVRESTGNEKDAPLSSFVASNVTPEYEGKGLTAVLESTKKELSKVKTDLEKERRISKELRGLIRDEKEDKVEEKVSGIKSAADKNSVGGIIVLTEDGKLDTEEKRDKKERSDGGGPFPEVVKDIVLFIQSKDEAHVMGLVGRRLLIDFLMAYEDKFKKSWDELKAHYERNNAYKNSELEKKGSGAMEGQQQEKLAAMLTSLETEKNEKEVELVMKQKEDIITNLNRELDALQKENRNYISSLDTLRGEINVKSEQLEQLEASLNETVSDSARLTEELRNNRELYDYLQKEKEDEVSRYKNELNNTQNTMQNANELLTQLQKYENEELQRWSDKCLDLQKTIHNKDEEVATLKAHLEEKNTADMDALRNELMATDAESDRLKQELEAQREEFICKMELLKEELSLREKQITQLNDAMTKLNTAVSSQVDDLNLQLKHAEIRAQLIEEDMNREKRAYCDKLQQKENLMNELIQARDNEIKQLTDKVAQEKGLMNSQHDELIRMLRDAEEEANQYKQGVQAQKEEVSVEMQKLISLQITLAEKEKEFSNLRAQLTTLKENSDAAYSSMASQANEIEDLWTQLSEADKFKASYEVQESNLRDTIKKLEGQVCFEKEEFLKLKKRLDDSQEAMLTAQQEMESIFQKQLEESKKVWKIDEEKKWNERLVLLQRTMNALQNEMASKNEDLVTLSENMVHMKAVKAQQIENIKQLEDDLSVSESRLATFKNELEERAHDESMTRQSIIDDLESKLYDMEILQRELHDKNTRIQNLTVCFDGLKTLSEEQRCDIEQLNKALAEKEGELTELQQQHGVHEGKMQDMERELGVQLDTVVALQQKLTARDSAVAEIKEKLADAEATVTEMQGTLMSREATVTELEQQLGEHEATVENLRQQIAVQDETASKFQSEINTFHALQQQRQQFSNFKEEEEILFGNCVQRDAEMESLKKEMKRIKNKGKKIADQASTLWEEGKQMKLDHEAEITNLLTVLQSTERAKEKALEEVDVCLRQIEQLHNDKQSILQEKEEKEHGMQELQQRTLALCENCVDLRPKLFLSSVSQSLLLEKCNCISKDMCDFFLSLYKDHIDTLSLFAKRNGERQQQCLLALTKLQHDQQQLTAAAITANTKRASWHEELDVIEEELSHCLTVMERADVEYKALLRLEGEGYYEKRLLALREQHEREMKGIEAKLLFVEEENKKMRKDQESFEWEKEKLKARNEGHRKELQIQELVMRYEEERKHLLSELESLRGELSTVNISEVESLKEEKGSLLKQHEEQITELRNSYNEALGELQKKLTASEELVRELQEQLVDSQRSIEENERELQQKFNSLRQTEIKEMVMVREGYEQEVQSLQRLFAGSEANVAEFRDNVQELESTLKRERQEHEDVMQRVILTNKEQYRQLQKQLQHERAEEQLNLLGKKSVNEEALSKEIESIKLFMRSAIQDLRYSSKRFQGLTSGPLAMASFPPGIDIDDNNLKVSHHCSNVICYMQKLINTLGASVAHYQQQQREDTHKAFLGKIPARLPEENTDMNRSSGGNVMITLGMATGIKRSDDADLFHKVTGTPPMNAMGAPLFASSTGFQQSPQRQPPVPPRQDSSADDWEQFGSEEDF